MNNLLKNIVAIAIISATISCNNTMQTTDTKNCITCTDVRQEGTIENADVTIDSIHISQSDSTGFTFRTNFAYISDDCAYGTKLVLLLPSNTATNTIGAIRTSNDSLIKCTTFAKTGCIECIMKDSICPDAQSTKKNYWVDVTLKSKIKNVSAFIYSQTPDVNQCNNFKHLSEK